MAAFSYQQQLVLQNHPHPLLVIDSSSSSSSSLLFPNTTPTLTLPHIYSDSNSSNSSWMSGEEEPNNNNSNPAYLFSSSSSNNSGISVLLQNTPSPNINNMDHKINKKKYNNNSKHASSSLNSNIPLSKDTREVIVPPNGKKQRKNMISSNDDDGPMTRDDIEEEEEEEEEEKICRGSSNNKKAKVESGKEEQVPTGYIRVRARRGQATDSHSLAERVRREKISERMKMLQALVPGCDKVTGKALMLDEIINYVQSLQNQVEFLSMKIASENPMFYDFGIDLDAFMVKPEGVSSLEEPQLQADDVQQCYSPNQSTTNILNTTLNNYSLPLLDTGTLLLLQQAQMPNILSEFQNNGQLLWDGDEQRQKFITQFGFTNNFSPFH